MINKVKHFLKNNEIALALGFILLFRGGYFYYESYLLGILLTIWIGYHIHKSEWRVEVNLPFYGVLLWQFIGIISCFVAVDPGMALLGWVKNLNLVLFFVLIQNQKREINKISIQIIKAVTFFSAIGMVLAILPIGQEFVMSNNRFQTLLQYANTGGMVSMIGILLLFTIPDKKMDYWLHMVILSMHTFMTSSRTVIVLGCLFGIILLIIQKKLYLKQALGVVTGVIVGWGIQLMLNVGSSARLAQVTVEASEFQNRLLYYKDAWVLFTQNLGGLGHLGYFYKIGSVQSGYDYYVKYPHSMPIEVAMDFGVLGIVLLFVSLAYLIQSKAIPLVYKVIGCFMVIHSFIDFDFQFTVTSMLVMILAIPLIHEKSIHTKPLPQFVKKIGLGCIGSLLLYFFVVTFFQYLGQSTIASTLYPYYTEANTSVLLLESNESLDVKRGLKVLKQNKYNWNLLEKLFDHAMATEDYEMAIIYIEQLLHIRPLKNDYYEQQVFAYAYYAENNRLSEQETIALLEKMIKIPYDMNDVIRDKTSVLKLVHEIELELSDNSQKIIEKAQIQLQTLINK